MLKTPGKATELLPPLPGKLGENAKNLEKIELI